MTDSKQSSEDCGKNLAAEIEDRRRAEAALQVERERLLITLDSVSDGVITVDAAGKVDYMNPVAEQLTGWSGGEASGRRLTEVFHLIDAETRQLTRDPVTLASRVGERITLPGYPILLQRGANTEHSLEVTITPILEQETDLVRTAVVFHDVTELHALAESMAYQATHDVLTGLYNRREFERRLQELIESAQERGTEHALCYLDLDEFKVVNDTCGHVVGDELLKELAVHLRSRLRETDTLARLGGDEFGVILEGCPLEQAERIADGLRNAIRDYKFTWQGRNFDIAASLGLVAIEPDSKSISEILSAADSACYVAKEQGRNRMHVFRSDDVALAKRHNQMQWVYRLQDALEADRLELYYQTVKPLGNTGEPDKPGYHEILVRVLDEQGVPVTPVNFIPAAERYRLMPAVDRWVIERACSMLAQRKWWDGDEVFAINVSGQSLGEQDFLSFISDCMDRSGVPAQHICFEITETAAIANLWSAQRLISVLKRRGCTFSLDDFGTGLSSFGYLKRLAVDFLKIDGRFIKHIVEDPVDCAMVESINQLSHVVGIRTIAESVETPEVLARLEELGVDYAQGNSVAGVSLFKNEN